MKKLLSLNGLLYLALILALLASLSHVAFAFSTTNGNNWLEAYISAVAIDLGLLALAAGISQRKKQNRSAWTLWAGVILFSVISTYANWLAGVSHVVPIEPKVGTVGQWLVSLRPILLSGVLPLLVIYLSEIVSGNYQIELSELQKQAKKVAQKAGIVPSEPPNDTAFKAGDTEALQKANDTRQVQVAERRDKVLEMIQRGMSQAAIAGELDVSLATIKRDAKALNGQVEK